MEDEKTYLPRHKDLEDDPDYRQSLEQIRQSGMNEGPKQINDRAAEMADGMVPDAVHGRERDILMGRIALTKSEMAQALGIGLNGLDGLIKRGEIPSVLLGRRRLFPVKAVEQHLAALAYAESGALDAWERALAKATGNRLKIARRRAAEKQRYLLKRLQERRRQGIPMTPDDAAEMRALVTELDTQRVLGERTRQKILREVEQAEREFGRGV